MKVLVADPTSSAAISYLKKQGIEVTLNQAISASELVSQVSKYEGLMVRSRTKVTKQVIENGINLKVVARVGSGYDNIDVLTCRSKNVIVVNAPDANSQAVAELTLCLIIAFLRCLPKAANSMKKGLWIKNEIWGGEICGKTVGVLGFGHVGKKVVALMKAFGADVLVHSRSYQEASPEEIFSKSDIVTIHLSLNNESRGCVSRSLLSLMKPTSILVNLSRGEIVDEDALYETMKNKKIMGAILDVFWQEPLPADSKWRKLENVILTPHIGAATDEALERASLTVAKDMVNVLKGIKPQNPVI